jgi:hypothetical protein
MTTPYLKHLQSVAKRKDKVRELHAAGLSHEAISKKVKLTRQRVGQILSEKKP